MTRLCSFLLAFSFAAGVLAQDSPTKPAESAPLADALHPHYKMETTLGDIVLRLDAEKAPISVLNFHKYVTSGYYNGTVFHRVMSTFMIQGGGFTAEMDKKTDGLLPAIKNEWRNGLKNDKGTISMARLGPDSATSQFFINVVDNSRLDQPQRDGAAYAVFGSVIEGMDTVEKIRTTQVEKHPKYPSPSPVTPVETVVIKSVALISEFDPAMVEEAMKKAEEEKKALPEKQMQNIIAKAEKETGRKFETTESGLKSIVLTEGTGDTSPSATDTVEVHYTGWLLDGTKFDSSVDRGSPSTFRLNGVIAGWTEGVALMKVGEKRKFIIPADLAYGSKGRPSIPPDSTLVFDIELLAIK